MHISFGIPMQLCPERPREVYKLGSQLSILWKLVGCFAAFATLSWMFFAKAYVVLISFRRHFTCTKHEALQYICFENVRFIYRDLS